MEALRLTAIRAHMIVKAGYEAGLIRMELEAGAGKGLDHHGSPKAKCIVDLQLVTAGFGHADQDQVRTLLLFDVKIRGSALARHVGYEKQHKDEEICKIEACRNLQGKRDLTGTSENLGCFRQSWRRWHFLWPYLPPAPAAYAWREIDLIVGCKGATAGCSHWYSGIISLTFARIRSPDRL